MLLTMRIHARNFALVLSIVFIAGMPISVWAYPYYTYHNFSPNTYVHTMPYVNVQAASYASASVYSYPSSYSYYSTYSPTYSYPTQSSGYYSAPSYATEYMSDGQHCYEGYGCYPFEVEDPHQWVYDKWTGTWY